MPIEKQYNVIIIDEQEKEIQILRVLRHESNWSKILKRNN